MKTTKLNLINFAQAISQIKLDNANVKTVYWISKNLRLIAPIVNEFDTLRKEVTNTVAFKAYQKEFEAATNDTDKKSISEKYKEVIEDADKELKEFVDVEIDMPDWYKIKIDDIEGIEGKYIQLLFDMIAD